MENSKLEKAKGTKQYRFLQPQVWLFVKLSSLLSTPDNALLSYG